MENVSGLTSANVSDFFAVQLENGNILSFSTWGKRTWIESDESSTSSSFRGEEWFSIKDKSPKLTLPPIVLGKRAYVGISYDGGTLLYSSTDNGETWTFKESDVRMGGDRYNLLTNPERDGLWAISSEFRRIPGSLWESRDHGANWSRVDDGSFPANTMRVVHDPRRAWTSYGLTDHGLYVSRHRGTYWQSTALTQPVYSLIFVDMPESNTRAFVAGTSSGVVISHDNGETWTDLANGLLAGPYTVVYSQGQLLASGESGYFTCDGLDCTGPAQVFPPEDGEDLIEVVEYYNTALDHYFITGSNSEKAMLDETDATSGWQRTGESFLAWEPGHSYGSSDVCRFYGSVYPGPNSHFYSNAAAECRMLQVLQEDIPPGGAGWKFEGWAMSVYPRYPEENDPCPVDAIPVYRAYNNGFALGKDSNHRYLTKPELMDEMTAQGWIDEGIAFCSPIESP